MAITDEDDPKRVRINFWVSASTYKFLERKSKRDGHSMSEIIRLALRDFELRDAGIQYQLDNNNKGTPYQGDV